MSLAGHVSKRPAGSVSRLLRDIMKQCMREKDQYQRAIRRALSRQPFLSTAAGICRAKKPMTAPVLCDEATSSHCATHKKQE